jgi:predicted nucleotide-binding protein
MPRRREQAPEVESRQLSRAEIDSGISKLRKRISEVQQLNPQTTRYDDARIAMTEANIQDTIRDIFGPQSREFERHKHHRIRKGPQVLMNPSREALQRYFTAGIPDTVVTLEALVSRLEEKREETPADPAPPPVLPRTPISVTTRLVFLVHGHDQAAAQAVARFLEKLDLQPIILHERANEGRTIIEKFEKNAEVAFAIVLLTPDDVGASVENREDLQPRARQNVVFELGYFVGRLGRERVCALKKGDVQIPSDFHGVVYVPMDDAEGWRLRLAREIKAAGISVDLNKAM